MAIFSLVLMCFTKHRGNRYDVGSKNNNLRAKIPELEWLISRKKGPCWVRHFLGGVITEDYIS